MAGRDLHALDAERLRATLTQGVPYVENHELVYDLMPEGKALTRSEIIDRVMSAHELNRTAAERLVGSALQKLKKSDLVSHDNYNMWRRV